MRGQNALVLIRHIQKYALEYGAFLFIWIAGLSCGLRFADFWGAARALTAAGLSASAGKVFGALGLYTFAGCALVCVSSFSVWLLPGFALATGLRAYCVGLACGALARLGGHGWLCLLLATLPFEGMLQALQLWMACTLVGAMRQGIPLPKEARAQELWPVRLRVVLIGVVALLLCALYSLWFAFLFS